MTFNALLSKWHIVFANPKRTWGIMAISALVGSGVVTPLVATSASATMPTTSAQGNAEPSHADGTVGPTHDVILKGHWVTGGPIKFQTTGHVRITKKWDSFNNCVENDGSEHKNLAVQAGEQSLRLGVTTVSSGSCFYERSKMHWQVTVLDANGNPTNNTADISLEQGSITHALDYSWECQGTTGTMRCSHTDILGILVTLSWS
jgi:hypothetical protein